VPVSRNRAGLRRVPATRLLVASLTVTAAIVPAIADAVPRSPDPDLYLVSCVVLDGTTGDTLSARCSVTDSRLEPIHPHPAEDCFYHAPTNRHDGYFYTHGSFTVSVPSGPTVVRAALGFEYEAAVDTIDVASDTTHVLSVRRWIDTQDLGWYSGDTHLHLWHSGGVYALAPSDGVFMGQCEGLSVVNCLDGGFTGAPHPASAPDCLLYISEEQRSSIYGHTALLGLEALVPPFFSTWWPLIMDIADEAHAQTGAMVVAAHPVTTVDFFDLESVSGNMLARELPADVIGGRIDGLEVLSYSNYFHQGRELDLWYKLLNCGFRLPACGGTDACMNRLYDRPLGGYRTYAHLPEGNLNFSAWLAAVRGGRSFVTNGPIFTSFEIESLAPGDSMSIPGADSATLEGSLSVGCQHPIGRVDIVVNGAVYQSFVLGPGPRTNDVDFTVTIDESSWIAARVFSRKRGWPTMGDSLFAHTNPVFVTLDGERIVRMEDAESFVGWIDDLEWLVLTSGEWSGPDELARVLAELSAANDFYATLAAGVSTGLPEQDPGAPQSSEPSPPVARLLPPRPNPFASEATIRFDLPRECEVTLRIYDVSGRLVDTLVDGRRFAGEHAVTWGGTSHAGRRAGAGLYLLRLTAGERTAHGKLVLSR